MLATNWPLEDVAERIQEWKLDVVLARTAAGLTFPNPADSRCVRLWRMRVAREKFALNRNRMCVGISP